VGFIWPPYASQRKLKQKKNNATVSNNVPNSFDKKQNLGQTDEQLIEQQM